MTALRGLDDTLQLKPDESVMIFGASGGIGHIAVQLAARMGCRVLAVASGEDGVALARRLGADVVVNGRRDDAIAGMRGFAPAGIDAALLTAGGPVAQAALSTLRDGGRVAYPTGVEPVPLVGPGLHLSVFNGDIDPELVERFTRFAPSLTVHVAKTFPLADATGAHRALAEHYLGKLALRVP
jgi:NADPH:quinone reductase-like Zn-dependent oxidoreductase